MTSSSFFINIPPPIHRKRSPMPRSGAELLVEALVAAGTKYLFSVSGNQILSIYDATIDRDIEIVHTRHEAAAVHMADGWGRLTETPGVALVTAGPGHCNALSALYTARMAESPLLLLSGHCPLAQMGRGAFQEMDQVALAAPLTKASRLARDSASLGAEIAAAIALSGAGRPRSPSISACPATCSKPRWKPGHPPLTRLRPPHFRMPAWLTKSSTCWPRRGGP